MADNTTFESSSVNSALTRIKNTLNYSLKENYGIEDPEITEKFLHLHGLDKSRFDFINNFETLIEKGIADESVDTNSNKCDVSINGYFSEVSLPIKKLVGYRYLYRKLKDMYGKKEAKRLSGEMYDMSLALADSTNILVPYCFSINASKLVMEGRPFGSLPSGIPHRISSYVNELSETVHQLSSHLCGAIAIGSYFFDIAHVMIYREHKTLSDLQNPEYRKYVENCLQAFVHSVNMLSRNGNVESPFSNISIFDAPKIKAIIDDDNMGWYFDKDDVLDGVPEEALKDCGDKDWKDYIVDVIKSLENIYMEVIDRGDPLHNNRPLEFPVNTFNISRRDNEDGTFSFEDPDWVKSFCNNHDIYRYNIYTSEGMKVASCLDFYTPFTFEDKDGNVSTMNIGDYVESRLTEDLGDKDAVETYLPGDEYLFTRHSQKAPIVRVIKLKNQSGKLIKITFTTGDEIWCTPDHELLLKNEELIKAKDLTEGSLLYKYLEVKKIEEYESDEPVYDVEVGNEDHLYKIKLPSGKNLTTHNCCRLVNDFDLLELGGQVNSFGGGASLSLGSHRVCTINLRRISLECNSWDDYLNRLEKRMNDASKILIAHKELIKDLVKRGTQPFIENGWLDLNRMFSTFGIMGYYEAAKDLTERFGDNNYLEKIIEFVDKKSKDISKETSNIFNVEQIPGESMSYRLPKTDSWIFNRD